MQFKWRSVLYACVFVFTCDFFQFYDHYTGLMVKQMLLDATKSPEFRYGIWVFRSNSFMHACSSITAYPIIIH